MKKFFRDNGLSLVLVALFLSFWGGQAFSGWRVYNEEEALHGRQPTAFAGYLACGHFWQATGENWESEFLQMGFYVVLTSFLFQRGSAESKDPDHPNEGHSPEEARRYGFLWRNSLSLAFLLLFLLSFVLHAKGGLVQENEKRLENHQSLETMGEFLSGAEFWFQSFQNWQSEFLAVFAIVTMTIFLRQHGSPESKAVGDSNSKTGST